MKIFKFAKKISLVLFAVIIVYTLYNQQIIMKNINKNILIQQEELKIVKDENEVLEKNVSKIGTEDHTILNARIRLGLLKPGEVPVINLSDED
ncbi:MAG: septum formation initiator family protein [Clostridium sp.]|nr:septum formation initiator family protein [Clostridium sp.]